MGARHLGPGQLAQGVQQGLHGPVWDIGLQLLQFLFGENLHEVVDVKQDPVQVDAVDAFWQEADHLPQTLRRREHGSVWEAPWVARTGVGSQGLPS